MRLASLALGAALGFLLISSLAMAELAVPQDMASQDQSAAASEMGSPSEMAAPADAATGCIANGDLPPICDLGAVVEMAVTVDAATAADLPAPQPDLVPAFAPAKADSGCSAAPGSSSQSLVGVVLGGLLLAGLILSRRRSR